MLVLPVVETVTVSATVEAGAVKLVVESEGIASVLELAFTVLVTVSPKDAEWRLSAIALSTVRTCRLVNRVT